MLTDSQCSDLRAAFEAHGYTVDEVVAAIGDDAHRALGRNSTVGAVRALAGRDDPIAVLTALWPLQQPVRVEAVERVLPGLVLPLVSAGVLSIAGEMARATIDIRPYGSDDGAAGWVVSDLSPSLDTVVRPIRPDFVLGVSSASSTLAQLTDRTPVNRALDLGTGCGVQALHLARHARHVVATDVSSRAVALARLTMSLNGVEVDVRLGDLYQPVAGETFDLITSNPPYVMAPPTSDETRLTYREGGWTADGLVEHVVRQGADQLTDGGTLQVLANWAHPVGGGWMERLRGWVRPTGCEAHIVQRETLDPFEYIELWLADAGLSGSASYVSRYADWLDYFEREQIGAVGMGWIVLHKSGRADPDIYIEDWPHLVEQPIAPAFAGRRTALDTERQLDNTQLLARAWVLAEDLRQETDGVPGAADPEHIVLRQQRGFRRAVAADTALAGILGACDGDLRLDQIIDSVATILGAEAASLRSEVVPTIRSLVVDGFLY